MLDYFTKIKCVPLFSVVNRFLQCGAQSGGSLTKQTSAAGITDQSFFRFPRIRRPDIVSSLAIGVEVVFLVLLGVSDGKHPFCCRVACVFDPDIKILIRHYWR